MISRTPPGLVGPRRVFERGTTVPSTSVATALQPAPPDSYIPTDVSLNLYSRLRWASARADKFDIKLGTSLAAPVSPDPCYMTTVFSGGGSIAQQAMMLEMAANGTPAFDNALALSFASAATTFTASYTVGVLANYLLVGVQGDLTNDFVTGVTYNGVAMTLLIKSFTPGGVGWNYVYGLASPATGAHNVVFSASSACTFLGGVAASYAGMGAPLQSVANTTDLATQIVNHLNPIAATSWFLQFARGTSSLTSTVFGNMRLRQDAVNNLMLAIADTSMPALVPPNYIQNYVGVTHTPTLLPDTTYYWQIVASNTGGITPGPVYSFTTPAADRILVVVNGVLTSSFFDSFTVRDQLNSAPNVGALDFPAAISGGESVLIGRGTLDPVNLLFAGEAQSVEPSYIDSQSARRYPASLIDETFRINKRRPFGTWVNTSASTIAAYLVAVFAPGFTSGAVQGNLPEVSITFDGSDDFMKCMTRLASAVNGYTDVDYSKDVKLALSAAVSDLNPIDSVYSVLNDPPIKFSTDLSQVRTRCYGKGHGESVTTDLAAGETIVPIQDAAMFNPGGGRAIHGTTSDGAQSEQITYAAVQLGGGGSLVGPAVAPSAALALALGIGAGLGVGVYTYAYTFVTSAPGETIPSPLSTVTTGNTPPPTSAAVLALLAGSGVEAGSHDYAVSFVTPAGETLVGPIATIRTGTSPVPAPPSWPEFYGYNIAAPLGNGLRVNSYYSYAVTFVDALGGETTAYRATIPAVTSIGTFDPTQGLRIVNIPKSTNPGVVARKIYRTISYYHPVNDPNPSQQAMTGPLKFVTTINDNTTVQYDDVLADSLLGAAPPTVNTAVFTTQQVNVTSIPLGPSGTTSRKIYRTAADLTQLKLQSTLGDNISTALVDSTSDASLGANAPTTSTATAQQVSIDGLARGPATTVSRKIYRTTAGGSQLKLWATIADNTTTGIFTDSSADSALGADAPTGDNSLLTQQQGQVLPGTTSIELTSVAPFTFALSGGPALGGWVIFGSQLVRYTGTSGNNLTGIPATGHGALQTTLKYGDAAEPSPSLVAVNGNNGLSVAVLKGSSFNIFVQRDALEAQTALGLLERDRDGNPTDGIREYMIIDERRAEASLIDLCDADLAQFARPIVSVIYHTRDFNTRSGKTVHVDTLGVLGDFVIQEATITIDELLFRFAVQASSVRFTFDDLLRSVALR